MLLAGRGPRVEEGGRMWHPSWLGSAKRAAGGRAVSGRGDEVGGGSAPSNFAQLPSSAAPQVPAAQRASCISKGALMVHWQGRQRNLAKHVM